MLLNGRRFSYPAAPLVKLSFWMECIHILDSDDALLKPGLNLLLAVDALMTETQSQGGRSDGWRAMILR